LVILTFPRKESSTAWSYCRLKSESVPGAESEAWFASEVVSLPLSVGLSSRHAQTDGVPPVVALVDRPPDADHRVDEVVVRVEPAVDGGADDVCDRSDIGGTEVAAVVGILKSRRKIQRRVGPTEAKILR